MVDYLLICVLGQLNIITKTASYKSSIKGIFKKIPILLLNIL